jgi:nitrite reductase (NADH) large subunit
MSVVIIGNGVAGLSVAETIRAADKNCEITILSEEKYPFYSRPRLIELLSNKATVEQIIIHNLDWYARNNIRLVLSCRITALDSESRKVTDASGREVAYDKLVIAAGASCLVPQIPGIGAENVLTLRNIDDAERIKKIAGKKKKAVVVGGGLLGIEVANSLLTLGVKVLVMEVFDRLLPRQLDSESSAVIQKLFEKKGMAFLVGRTIQSIRYDTDRLLIICSEGKETYADFMVVSAGIRPDFSVIDGSAVKRNRGIVVDDRMRTTIQDIYACGDVAEHRGIIYGLWQPAREQGIICGSNILGKQVVYRGSVIATRLKAAGVELASIGEIESNDGVSSIMEKDENAGFFKKLFIRDKKLVGAVLIGNIKEAARLQQMIKNREEAPL